MKILVPIKRVIDANVRVHVKSDGSGVETANIKMAMNPFCEIAVEEAIRIKEAGHASEIIVITIGTSQCQDILRSGLAMGADRAILIETEAALQPLAIAKLLKAIVERQSPQLVILGKQAIDDDNNQTGQMLSALLGWAQGTFASKVVFNDGNVEVTREIDGGLETVSLQLPAKKKPLDILCPDDLGIDVNSRLKVISIEQPAKRAAGIKLADVQELMDKLKNEAKVI